MLVPLDRVRTGLLGIGALPTDRPDDRLRRGALVVTATAISFLAIFWVGTYLLLGRPLSAAIPFAYQVISVVGLVYLSRTGDFGTFKFSQTLSMLILPFLLQWTLGGFINSGAVMIWAFTALLAALVLYTARQAVWFFVAYIALTVVAGVLDPMLSATAVPLPSDLRLLLFVLDIGAVSFVAYSVLQYFVAARERAQQETDEILHNVLPESIADRLRAGETRIADDYESVTVVFADVAGFTPMARKASADEVIGILDRLFTAFDALADKYGLEKIKTIGDAYMVVSGAPQRRPDHARAAADMALAMLGETARVAQDLGRELTLRVGMHSGAAAAGVIGKRKFIYDLWGDAVNVASRMETTGVPGRIHVSEEIEAALRDSYEFEDRGAVDVKGLGEMRTFFLVGRKSKSRTAD
jgi:adenylate cyclase